LYSENFNPNTQKYLVYAQDVDKIELPGLLMELSKLYFEKLGDNEEENDTSKKQEKIIEKEVYQCTDCLTVYDAEFGDATANINPGTSFKEITSEYVCPVCEASKELFELVKI